MWKPYCIIHYNTIIRSVPNKVLKFKISQFIGMSSNFIFFYTYMVNILVNVAIRVFLSLNNRYFLHVLLCWVGLANQRSMLMIVNFPCHQTVKNEAHWLEHTVKKDRHISTVCSGPQVTHIIPSVRCKFIWGTLEMWWW